MTITNKINLDLIPMENPMPGKYRAVLLNTERRQKAPGRTTIRLEWGLINHPARDCYYIANSFFGITSPGLLAKALWSWKRIPWKEEVKKMQEGGPATPERFVGDEADVVVDTWETKEGFLRPVVKLVYPPGRFVRELENGSFVNIS
jgi:hypothetical protein